MAYGGYQGGHYGSQGGDEALDKRFEQLRQMQLLARQQGLTDQDAPSGVPEGLKSAFFGVVDVISRPNYAMAGAFETLIGKGEPGEYAPERMFRELFSGVAGLEGDKETFGQVLEQAGVGEGGRLSDLVGENGVTRRFDPTLRGTVGLALDIFTDPLTYISAPAKNAAVVIGRGGKMRFLTKLGLEERTARYVAELDKYKKVLGLADDASESAVLQRLSKTEEFRSEYGRLAKSLTQFSEVMDDAGLKYANRIAENQARSVVYRRVGASMVDEAAGLVDDAARLTDDAAAAAAKKAAAKGGKDWFLEEGLRFRVPGLIDVPLKADRAFAAAVGKTANIFNSVMSRSDIGKWIIEAGTEGMDSLAQVFTRHPLLAHKNRAYKEMEAERFALFNGAEQMARLEARDILTGIGPKAMRDEEFVTSFVRVMENPESAETMQAYLKEAERLGVIAPEKAIERSRDRLLVMLDDQVSNGLLDAEKAERFMGRYWPRDLSRMKNADDVIPAAGKKQADKLRIKQGQYIEERVHDSWDEYVTGMKEAGQEVVWDLQEALENRLKVHYQAMVDLHFVEEVNLMFGLGAQKEIAAINKALREIAGDEAQLSKGDQELVGDILSRSSSYSGQAEARAAQHQELTRIINEAPETEVLRRMESIIDGASESLTAAQRERAKLGAIQTYQRYRRALRRAEIHDLMTERGVLLEERELYREMRAPLNKAIQRRGRSLRQMRRAMGKAVRQRAKDRKGRVIGTLREASKRGVRDVDRERLMEVADVLEASKWGEVRASLGAELKKLDELSEAYDSLPKMGDTVTTSRKAVSRDMTIEEMEGILRGDVKSKDAYGLSRKEETKKWLSEAPDLELERKLYEMVREQQRRVMVLKTRYKNLLKEPEKEIRKVLDKAKTLELKDVDAYIEDAMEKVDAKWGSQLQEIDEHLALMEDARGEINDLLRANRDYISRATEDIDALKDKLGRIRTREHLLRTKKRLARSQRKKIREQISDTLPSTLREIESRDMARLKNAKPQVKAAIIGRMLDRVTTVEHAERFFAKYKDVLESLDMGEVNKIRETILGRPKDTPWVDSLGQKYVKHTVTVANKQMEVSVPLGVAQDLNRFQGAWQQNPEVKGLLAAFDFLNNTFKVGVTRYFLSFNVRNGYSNVASSYLDIGLAALNPKFHKMAIDVMRGADGTLITNTGRHITYAELRGELFALGMNTDKLHVAEMTGRARAADPIEAMVHRELRQEGARQKVAGVANKAINIPGQIENEARALHYIVQINRGFSPADAARQVNRFLFDYSALSPTERNAFKRLFPFYTWTRKNVERQIKNLYENPGRIATQVKVFAGDRGPEGDTLPEYLRGQMNVKLSDDDDGQVWVTGIDLPIKNINILWSGGVGKTLKDQLGMVTPLIKQPLEYGLGKELFSGQPTRGINRVPSRLASAMDRNLPQWAKDYFQFQKFGEGDSATYTANSTRMYLTMKALFMGRITSEGVRVDELAQELGSGDAVKGAAAAMRLLSGLHLRDMDMSAQQRQRLYNRSQRLEEILVEAGYMREMTKRYIPKENRPKQASRGYGASVGSGYGQVQGRN